MARMVTIAEAAEELGCGVSNIHRLIKQHNIKTQKKRITKIEEVVRRINAKHIDIETLKQIRGNAVG